MGSIVYEISHNAPGFQPGASTATKNSIEQYLNHAIKFGKWAKEHFGCKKCDDMIPHIQAYADHLVAQGKSASTVRTYIAGCCHAFQIPMSDITLPKRHCYENTRSRGTKALDERSDSKREASPRLYDFANAVGIRRHEYLALRGRNFKYDESGYPCVEVEKGKGGKYTLQRVMPEDADAVRVYFDGSNQYIFSKAEMSNKIDLHHIRAAVAQRAYQYYLNRLNNEPGYRAQLEQEIEARWKKYRGTPPKNSKKKHNWTWDSTLVQGNYFIRGNNRKVSIENGFATQYDRCAVMAVSVFHLSHWRCDVTIDNYLLAK